MNQGQTFKEHLQNERDAFTRFIAENYSVSSNLELRTAVDSFIVAFDQAVMGGEGKWEIQSVGTNLDITNGWLCGVRVPQYSTVITQDQFDIIEFLADKSKDEEFNTIYTINNLKFRMVPYWG